MSKRLIRVLSLILTLVMFMSVSTQAFALGGGGLGDGWDRPIGEDEIRDFDGPVEEEEEPTDYFSAYDDQGLAVTVEAPMGALPTLAEVRAERVEAEDIRDAVDAAVEGNPQILLAVDISFWLYGQEIEPEQPVRVKIAAPELEDKTDLTLVHIPDEAEPETIDLIPDSELEFALGTNEIAFESGSFSVYAIVEGGEGTADDQPYRTTYAFYNADGTEYVFKDAAGRDQSTQILKNGEILEDVGIPTKGASQNAKFVGWYVWNDDGSFGEKVEVGEAKTVTANKTIKLKAKLQGIVNVFFVTAVMKDDQGQPMARSIVTVKQVEFTVGQTAPITVDTKDVTTDAPTNEQAVIGWNRDEAAANGNPDATPVVDGVAEGTNGVITLYANGSVENITDVMLFPAIAGAYWLYFNENDGGTGGGASYTPPQFVTVGGKPTEPTPPHRTGYSFGGWYKDAACTQAFDFTVPMTQTTTVYAKWVGDATTYTVIIWVQRTSDSASLPTNGQNRPEADRTYDFYKAYSVNASTGGTATVANSPYKTLANSGQPLYNDGHIEYSRCDANKTIAADGSTVMNVYYDRDVMTIHFKVNRSDSTDTYATWYGLYDATFAESNKTWPVVTGKQWSSLIRNAYNERVSGYDYTFLDSFKSFDNNTDDSLTVWQINQSSSYYEFIFQKETLTSGQYQNANSSVRSAGITLSNKYTGFTLYQYRNGSYGSWTNCNPGDTVALDYSDLYIRYSRNSYNLEYHNGTRGTDGTVLATHSVKYEQPLAGHANPSDPTYPVAADADHFQFIGWFADSSWSTLVTFSELSDTQKQNYTDWYGVSNFVVIDKMPAHHIPLYAGYALKGWDCALNPNGGRLTNADQAGLFWLAYGGKFSSDLKQNIKREGYVFQGWMVANVPLTADGELNILDYEYDTQNHRQVTDFSNWTITDTPWQFDTGITGPTALMAKWFYASTIGVVYDAGEGTEPPEDKGAYSDNATTVAFRAPTPPENNNFIGWDIDGTEAQELLQPGATFKISSEYAKTVNGKMVVTLKAVYHTFNSEEEVPVTHIDWYANNTKTAEYVTGKTEDGADIKETLPLHSSDTPLQINQDVPIHSATEFSNFGYKFLGWAKLHNDNGTLKDHKNAAVTKVTDPDVTMDYALTADNLYLKYEGGKYYVEYNGAWEETKNVAADEKQPYDDLYAVWDYVGVFYVFHSSDATVDMIDMAAMEAETYDLTATVKKNHLYGGYYKAYLDVTDAQAIAAAKANTAVSTTKYDGSALKVGDNRFWTKSKAYTATADATLGGGTGSAMTPKNGVVYYMKEVPVAYLCSRLSYVYDWADGKKLVNLFPLTAIDDSYYSAVQFHVEVKNKDYQATICASFSITQRNSTERFTNLATDFANVKRGYIGYAQADELLVANSEFTVLPQWVTLDGVTVDGTARTYKIGELVKDGITG